ncbi:hypothetical protein MG296_06875 [Flavobacteriaceae bacterium TK19130]|nr:hypothetical protein [Thermobacterium salinum]
MDELDLLKKEWQSREQELPTLSYNDIYKMLLKKSSSIVKWIFYISIAELLFWTLLAFVMPESSEEVVDGMGMKTAMIVINILHYLIFIGFIYYFYKNYKSIQVTDSVKQLMKNILKTRKTVKYFVMYNVGASALMLIGFNIYYYLNKHRLFEVMSGEFGWGNTQLTEDKFITVFFLAQLIMGVVILGLLLLFYRILYGILLRRLKRNYSELKKMEM